MVLETLKPGNQQKTESLTGDTWSQTDKAKLVGRTSTQAGEHTCTDIRVHTCKYMYPHIYSLIGTYTQHTHWRGTRDLKTVHRSCQTLQAAG